jgi:hypothetical protein
MLLIYPPIAIPSEPPAGIAQLAGSLHTNNLPCTIVDCNIEGILYLLDQPQTNTDTWSKRAWKNKDKNLESLRSDDLYSHPARYAKAVSEINRLLENKGKVFNINLSLANYQDPKLSPIKSDDLLGVAKNYHDNIFFPYFSKRLGKLISDNTFASVGLSLNYLSQALTCLSMIGFIKTNFPTISIILGGGLITSWASNPNWRNPFAEMVDLIVEGPGEKPLLRYFKKNTDNQGLPDYSSMPHKKYLSPGPILPYAASSGCYWNKCSFCPEKAEKNPYRRTDSKRVIEELSLLAQQTKPILIHFLDNALAPRLLKAIVESDFSLPWYGFARVSPQLTRSAFCNRLHDSGCRLLKLGIESGDQTVLDAMGKGIDLKMVSKTLKTLHESNISTYVYLLFGTPFESLTEARATLNFVVDHHKEITFLNLAIFNMPVCSEEVTEVKHETFYQGDLSLYTDFDHPRGWNRQDIRRFLDQEFKRHPKVAEILRHDPPTFTSNHAPFFRSKHI